jgi:putative oxidoreductase
MEGFMTSANVLVPARSNGRVIALWLSSGLVAFAFLAAGGSKLAGAAAMVELFNKVGLGQWFRDLTGMLEVAGAIGVLIPRYAFYAAVLLAIVMVGAIVAQVAVLGDSVVPPLVLLGLTVVIATLRRPSRNR